MVPFAGLETAEGETLRGVFEMGDRLQYNDNAVIERFHVKGSNCPVRRFSITSSSRSSFGFR